MTFNNLLLTIAIMYVTLKDIVRAGALFLLTTTTFFMKVIVHRFNLHAKTTFCLTTILLKLLIAPGGFCIVAFTTVKFCVLKVRTI